MASCCHRESANLAPQSDDSQSNLGWDRMGKQFLSQPISGDFFTELTLSPLTLSFGRGNGDSETLDLDNVILSDDVLDLSRFLEDAFDIGHRHLGV